MNDAVWRQEVTAGAGQNSSPILIPAWVNEVTVRALPGGGGTANVQHSLDDPDNLTDWSDWDEGSVSVPTTQALLGIVTALRIQAVTAAATMQVTGRRLRQ